MTTLISAQSLRLNADHGTLFQDLSFTVSHDERIGLIGHNGCGKSTLLKLLAGHLEADAGEIQYAAACRLQLVEQHLPAALHTLSARDVLMEALAHDSAQAWRADSLLVELGLAEQAGVAVSALSGGQHTRLLLGRAVLRQPNLLLLDEPSNHLDLPSLLWLEDFLNRWRGGLILVSHDARLLDRTTRRSWILRDAQLQRFELPCTEARAALAEADLAAEARRSGEQKEIDRLAASSKRLAIWGREHDNEKLVRKAKSMEKRIDKLKEAQTALSRGSPWRLSVQGQALSADSLMAFESLPVRAAPGLPPLFQAEALWLRPGDKVALLGANGSGKSSLLRQCWGDVQQGEPQAGWRWHPAASIAYYDQNLQQLAAQDTLIDALYPLAPLPEVTRRQALIAAGFAYARHGQRVATLSGGERARLLFLGLSLASHHLLWLDEPTNHLDLDGKSQLAEALQGFPGGVLLVSHDRELIEAACNRFWVLREGRLQAWPDAASAYASLFEPAPQGDEGGVSPAVRVGEATPVAAPGEAEAQWQRWCELDALLQADLQRKPKYQKPQSQQAWRQEMQQLERLLGL
ncbi:ATP-binding cassette domain-containing protein [Paludibacterium sp. THUN1379]|uniref:ABC-F family ATP-binding cassette domain-containing protein n=1 Tax=Paludibacterium sp. THUN1379 TaxID=3112107 RepID=UPI00308F45AA|nr:ATP-binding cassette domain-containing protein [Paludibacterium sp. THUN1379]